MQKLKSGELAALVRVIGKPLDFFSQIPAHLGLERSDKRSALPRDFR
jgi:hypothetical protein